MSGTALQDNPEAQANHAELPDIQNALNSLGSGFETSDFDEMKQNISTEVKENANLTPTTYEILNGSDTKQRLLNIISSNPNEFKNLPGDTAEKKLEYIFTKIRNSIVLFMKNKLGESPKIEYVINNTIAPAIERSLLELLREQGNETNISMLEGVDKISFDMLEGVDKISFDTFRGFVQKVGEFANNTIGSYNTFNQWMNALDYLSVHNGILNNPETSEVLTNPLKFYEYLNNPVFGSLNRSGDYTNFSPYEQIPGNIFKINANKKFEFGIPSEEIDNEKGILAKIKKIEVVNNPKTTSLIAKMLDKPEQFLQRTQGFQQPVMSLLDGLDVFNSITKGFGTNIIWEIEKSLQSQEGIAYRVFDFICKLIGITGGVEGIIKRWHLNKLNLTDEKNNDIGEIFKGYKQNAGEKTSLNITDENTCKTALNNFSVTDPKNHASTKGDYLRDSIVNNMHVSLISPNVVRWAVKQHILPGTEEEYLKEETIIVNGKQTKKTTIDSAAFTPDDKLNLAQYHLVNMKTHLENYNKNNLSDFYKNIHSTEDIALCITASLYADKDDVIDGVKAKAFLPENYTTIRSDGTVTTNGESGAETVSPYEFTPGEYPFANVPPYKNIAAYDLRHVKMVPALTYSELSKQHEGSVTLTGSNITNKGYEYPTNNTIGNKSNNPCDISHFSEDEGHIGDTIVADGQRLAKYARPVDGIASAMRLLKNKYKNKSVTEIDTGGYQGYYKPTEDIGLSALRIKRITDQCNALGIGPHQMLDFDDPMTLKAFVAQIAVLETGTRIGQKLLDEAYELAFKS